MSSCPAYKLCLSPNSFDLPLELRIPLPTSSTCSENGAADGRLDIASDKCFLWHESIEAEGSPHQESLNASAEVAGSDVIKDDSKDTYPKEPAVSLDELARLAELEAYESHQSISSHSHLKQLYFSTGLNRRLGRIASLAYHRMASLYKVSDQVGFVATHRAYENLSSQCQTAILSPQIGSKHSERPDVAARPQAAPTLPWIHRHSPAVQKDILMFLVDIRTNDNFLSDRIAKLSPTELKDLTSSHQSIGSVSSVLQNHSNVKVRGDGYGNRSGNVAPGLDALRTFYQNDPYFLLLYGVFDDSTEPGDKEHFLRSDTWSKTCARVLADGKRGSDEFAITTLNAFTDLQDWVQLPQLEVFLMQCLQEGAFLLDPPQPTDFKQPAEIRNAQAVIAGSHFFDKALKLLFHVLADGLLESGVPKSALDFAHATLRKIEDPRIRLKAKTFIISRWYFQCFLSNILVHPESHGILMEHHVGETARRMILQELAHRMQKLVTDVLSPWNHTIIVAPEIQTFVAKILGLFEPPPLAVNTPALDDISCLMEFFYPELSLSLPATTSDGSAPSTASSVAGSSTLMASSVTPSSSGTSIITHEFHGEDPNGSRVKDKDVCSPIEMRSSEIPLLEKPFDGCRLQNSYNKLKERPPLEVSKTSGWVASDWATIHISQDRNILSTKLKQDDEVLLKPGHQSGSRDDGKNIKVLENALTRLIMDRTNFQTPILQMGNDTTHFCDNQSVLMKLFDTNSLISKRNFDFAGSIFWWKASQSLNELSSDDRNILDDLLRSMSQGFQARINSHEVARDYSTLLYRSLETLGSFHQRTMQTWNDRWRALRIKMWYISDVRHSAVYEDALYVTRALRAMTSSSRLKQSGGISTWARHRLRNSLGTDRSESQTLEILTAHKDHGGLTKLADEQIDLTWRWLTRNSIENFCKGEERIHRFCFEVQKCTNKLAGVNLLESPVLWSSRLFEQEKSMYNTRPSRSTNHEPMHRPANDDLSARSNERAMSSQRTQIPWAPSLAQSPSTSNFNPSREDEAWSVLSSSGPSDLVAFDVQSRLKYSSGITPIPYPLQTYQILAPSKFGFINNAPSEEIMSAKMNFTQHVKRILMSLIISDLGYLLLVCGSETDAWINLYSSREVPPFSEDEIEERKPGEMGDTQWPTTVPDTSPPGLDIYARQKPTNKTISSKASVQSLSSSTLGDQHKSKSGSRKTIFPYKEAYKSLLSCFSCTLDPYRKLNILSDLHSLVSSSLEEPASISFKSDISEHKLKRSPAEPASVSNPALNVPRTKATSLEEVIANCSDRRMSTLKLRPMVEGLVMSSPTGATSPLISTTDPIAFALRDIFRDPSLRPATLFRDLQYIAAFIPASILDHPSQGTAFWDAGLAALALKDELCASMVTRATEITSYHVNNPSYSLPPPGPLATSDMRDAAHLWLLAAKEGSPVAARELGLFYLTHPELLPLATFPFSKAKDVFRATLTNEWGVGSNGGKSGNLSGGSGGPGLGTSSGGQPGGLDPWTFAVVFHWMEVAANGGDRDASDFLRGNGELSGGR